MSELPPFGIDFLQTVRDTDPHRRLRDGLRGLVTARS